MHSAWMLKIGRFVSGKLLPKGWAYPIVSGPLRGTRFVLGAAPGEGGGATSYFNLYEPEQTQAFVNTVSRGETVFDIGANVGYYTLLGSKLVGKDGLIIAFEPVMQNLINLYRHIVLNKANNIMIIPAACSDRCSLATFDRGNNCALGHLVQRELQDAIVRRNMTVVPTITVDQVAQHINDLPDVLKIDVEGSELEVLRGAKVTLHEAKPDIFLSVHSADLRSSCLEYLKGMNYQFQSLSRDTSDPTEFLCKCV